MSTELVYSEACTAASDRANDAALAQHGPKPAPADVDPATWAEREAVSRAVFTHGHFTGERGVMERAYGPDGDPDAPDPLAAVLREHGCRGSSGTGPAPWTSSCWAPGCGWQGDSSSHPAHQADVVRAFLFGTETGR